MRIVHVVESLDPANGGPSVSVPSLAAAQASLGNEVVLVFYAESRSEDYVAHRQIPGFANVNLCPVKPGGLWEKVSARSARNVLLRVLPSTDIVHIHGIWGMMLLRAAASARNLNIRYVFAPRGMLDPWSLSQKRIKKKIMWWAVWKRVLGKAYFLHALNKAEAELIRPLGLKCPTKIIPNGVFLNLFENNQECDDLFRLVPGLRSQPFVLFLSRMHYKKGIDLLLDAFAIVAKQDATVRLVIAGPDSGFGGETRKWIDQHRLWARVHVVGPLYGQAKDSALASAKCFCLPSRQEGFSMAILEALSAGLPVVITHNCHFPEVAEVGAGKVVDQSPKQIAEGLLAFVRDEGEQATAGRAGQKLVASRYQWQQIAEETLHAYSLDESV
jgi:glycosyltransferase involved in cell wall biosynthesis